MCKGEIDRLTLGIKNAKLLSSDTFMKGKVHPCTGTEALYRPYGPQGE